MPTDESDIKKSLNKQYGIQLVNYFPELRMYLENPDTVGLLQYERMLTTDETVGAGFDLIVLTTLTMLGHYQHPSKTKITKAVQNALEGISDGNFSTAAYQIMSSLWAGFSVTEIVWDMEGSQVVPRRFVTLDPNTIRFKPNIQGQLEQDSIRQTAPSLARYGTEGLILPRDKMVVMTHNRRFGNWYGQSIFRRAYKNWLIKDHILKSWARALDRYGAPLLVGFAPNEEVTDPNDDTKTVNAVELMLTVLTQAADATAIAVPLAETKDMPQVDVRAVTEPNGQMGDGFLQFVLYLNKAIMRAMLLPSLLTEEGQTSGSYALASTHFSLFEWMVAGIRDELIEALVEQIIIPFIIHNFGPQDSYGTFSDREVRLTEKETLSKVFKNLTEIGFMSPEVKEDYDFVRRVVGIPELTKGIGKLTPQLKEQPKENNFLIRVVSSNI